MNPQIEALIAATKADRAAAGLVSTYCNLDGQEFEMHHPTKSHKEFYDFKYALREKYATEADLPAADKERLVALHAAMIAAHNATLERN